MNAELTVIVGSISAAVSTLGLVCRRLCIEVTKRRRDLMEYELRTRVLVATGTAEALMGLVPEPAQPNSRAAFSQMYRRTAVGDAVAASADR